MGVAGVVDRLPVTGVIFVVDAVFDLVGLELELGGGTSHLTSFAHSSSEYF